MQFMARWPSVVVVMAIILCVIVVTLIRRPYPARSDLGQCLLAQLDASDDPVYLQNCVSDAWHRAIVFGPYSDDRDILRVSGIRSQLASRTQLESRGNFCLFVFMHNGQYASHEVVYRYEIDCTRWSLPVVISPMDYFVRGEDGSVVLLRETHDR